MKTLIKRDQGEKFREMLAFSISQRCWLPVIGRQESGRKELVVDNLPEGTKITAWNYQSQTVAGNDENQVLAFPFEKNRQRDFWEGCLYNNFTCLCLFNVPAKVEELRKLSQLAASLGERAVAQVFTSEPKLGDLLRVCDLPQSHFMTPLRMELSLSEVRMVLASRAKQDGIRLHNVESAIRELRSRVSDEIGLVSTIADYACKNAFQTKSKVLTSMILKTAMAYFAPRRIHKQRSSRQNPVIHTPKIADSIAKDHIGCF